MVVRIGIFVSDFELPVSLTFTVGAGGGRPFL